MARIPIKKYKVLLEIAKCQGAAIYDIGRGVGYNMNFHNAAVNKICHKLTQDGFLKRKDVPRNIFSCRGRTGGHKYKYSLTRAGEKKVKWIRSQGYYLAKGKLYRD